MHDTNVPRLIRPLFDFVFPPACCLCGRSDEAIKRGSNFCAECETELTPPPGNTCQCCSGPVGPYVTTQNGCHHCRAVKLKFGPVVRYGLYDDLMRLACLKGKQRGGEPIIHGLAKLLVCEHRLQFESLNPDFVIPVPQHWTQRFFRSFNPAMVVASVIAKELQTELNDQVLRKRRATGTQKSLSVAERKQNVRGAFVVDQPEQIAGKSILLVDDVMTTGITANEITTTLNKAGARCISLAVLARVLQD